MITRLALLVAASAALTGCCSVPPRVSLNLHSGQQIEFTADVSRRVWIRNRGPDAVRVETDEAGEKRVTELTGERPYFYGGHQGPFWARVTALGEATVQLEADKYHELKVEIPGAGGAGGGGE